MKSYLGRQNYTHVFVVEYFYLYYFGGGEIVETLFSERKLHTQLFPLILLHYLQKTQLSR